MEKFKAWIREHKAAFGVLLGLLAVGIYWLVRKKTSAATSEEPAGSMIYQPPAGGGSGGDSAGGSGGGGYNGQAEQNRTFLTGITDALSSFMTNTQNLLTGQQQTVNAALAAQATNETSMFAGLKDLIGQLKTAPAAMPNVPAPVTSLTQPAAGATVMQLAGGEAGGIWHAPTAEVVGGSGGGMIYGTHDQIDEFAAGGSRNMGGNYSLDFTGWQPSQKTPTVVPNSPVETAINKSVSDAGWVNRMIGGSKYTVPAGTRSDWKPGQAFK